MAIARVLEVSGRESYYTISFVHPVGPREWRKMLDWRQFQEVFHIAMASPSLSRRVRREIAKSYAEYGVDLKNLVHLYLALHYAREHIAAVLTVLGTALKESSKVFVLGQLFVMAGEAVLRELFAFVPEDIAGGEVEVQLEPAGDHSSGLKWDVLSPALVAMWQAYYELDDTSETLLVHEVEAEAEGREFRSRNSEPEVLLNQFISLVVLIRLLSWSTEVMSGMVSGDDPVSENGFEPEQGYEDGSLLSVAILWQVRKALAYLPPEFRSERGIR